MKKKDDLQVLDHELQYREDVRQQHLAERTQLIDAARESARTFDKAVLTFGSAIFGFSIAFVKDVAPNPIPCTITWLAVSWMLFSVGLLVILLSFLFSHKACMFEIKVGRDDLDTLTEQIKTKQPLNTPANRKINYWTIATTSCNYVSVSILFAGLLCWSVFALSNISKGSRVMDKVYTPPDSEKRGYVPPTPAPTRTPPPPPATQPQAPEPKK